MFISKIGNIKSLLKIPKRFKYKEKWAASRKKQEPSQIALEHFDRFYQPVYAEYWPSIRLALLSQKKSSALINNFSNNSDEVILELREKGADDIVLLAQYVHNKKTSEGLQKPLDEQVNNDETTDDNFHKTENDNLTQPVPRILTMDDDGASDDRTNIYDFVPATKVMSSTEELEAEELQENIYRPKNIAVTISKNQYLTFPTNLKVHAFMKGDVTMFDPPKGDNLRLLDYYLFDAASVLPVIALDLQPGDDVLDLCAAPGGKSLAILQTNQTDALTCNDSSISRLDRLREVFKWYTPFSDKITITKRDGMKLSPHMMEAYDKVLVDVPCLTDRHMLQEEENNIFLPYRNRERLALANTQKHLLCAAVQACKPGGSVVYSTCTLSANQNDGVIQASMEWLWENTRVDVSVENTSLIAQAFSETFVFYPHCRYGQLVVPNIQANFGPMYFCKLNRIN